MDVWPAIDLRDGRCVRLEQGDFQRETVFGDDPAAMARHWVAEGAQRLHLVDLDGARDGRPSNLEAIRAIRAAIDVPCQLGGGMRDDATIAATLELGIDQVVVGTQAIADPDWFHRAANAFAGRLVLGIDARDGRVATDGWQQTSGEDATEFAKRFADEPLAAIVYTDIATDGMLTGPNLAAQEQMLAATALPVIASGGITRPDDVAALAAAGVAGCIIGRALYEKRLKLADALIAARPQREPQN